MLFPAEVYLLRNSVQEFHFKQKEVFKILLVLWVEGGYSLLLQDGHRLAHWVPWPD